MLCTLLISGVVLTITGCATDGNRPASAKENDPGIEMSSEGASVPDRPPDITGTVTERNLISDSRRPPLVRLLVEETPASTRKPATNTTQPPKGGVEKLYVDIADQTRILSAPGGAGTAHAQEEVSKLEVGRKVSVWHMGVTKRSYPGQSIARVVIIDEAG